MQITKHRIFKGWCAGCQKWYEAPVDLREEALGQGRIGVRLTSLIAYLRTSLRLPFRQIRDLLRTLHGFEVSLGEMVEVLHRIKAHALGQSSGKEGSLLWQTRTVPGFCGCRFEGRRHLARMGEWSGGN